MIALNSFRDLRKVTHFNILCHHLNASLMVLIRGAIAEKRFK